MADLIWLSLSTVEEAVLEKALSAYLSSTYRRTKVAQLLLAKVKDSKSYPEITVGVYGGLVQWTLGNPFPIRVCDYDGDGRDLPDIDERGHRCNIWFEPPDPSSETT